MIFCSLYAERTKIRLGTVYVQQGNNDLCKLSGTFNVQQTIYSVCVFSCLICCPLIRYVCLKKEPPIISYKKENPSRTCSLELKYKRLTQGFMPVWMCGLSPLAFSHVLSLHVFSNPVHVLPIQYSPCFITCHHSPLCHFQGVNKLHDPRPASSCFIGRN